jgi:hypothetical protein
MSKALAGLAAGMFFVGLAGCSGGGGGGGGGGTQAPLQYTGNSNPAFITETNAGVLAANATNTTAGADVAGAFSSAAPGSESPTGQGLIDVGRRLAHRAQAIAAKPRTDSRLNSVPVNETDACTNGGTVSISGDLSPSGIGTVNVTFNNCGEGGDFIAGTATLRIDRVLTNQFGQLIPTDFTVSFGRLALRGSANVDIGGSVRAQIDVPTNKETITENSVFLDLNTGRMAKAEIVFVDTFDNLSSPSSYTEEISGRVFDGTHGFVTIATNAPLRFPTLTQLFPSGGELVLSSGNRRIQILPNSTTRLALGLDLDGVVGFERQVRLGWTDLTGPIGSDLGDTDRDGMHNSWETAFGLKPGVDDAASDDDHDGFSNLVEYVGGGNPTNGAVIPTLTVGAPIKVATGVSPAISDTEVPGRSAIASDGTNYLLVSCRQNGATVGVFGVLISENGQVLNNFPISSEPCPQRPAVAFGSGIYLVVVSRGSQIVSFRVNTGGTVLNPAGDPISSLIADGSTNFFPAAAFDGTNFLVVWRKFIADSKIHAARVTTAGVVLSQFPVTSGGIESSPMLASDGTNYLVVWTTQIAGLEDVLATRVSAVDTVLDSPPIAIATAAGSQTAGGVAFDGSNYLVVWDHTTSVGLFPPVDGQIFGRRITPAGALLDGTAGDLGIPISSTGLFRTHSSSVAFAGGSFLVTWGVGSFPNSVPFPAGIYATRISKGGVRLDGPPSQLGVPVSGPPSFASQFVHPVAASKGSSSLIAWVNNTELSGQLKDILAAPVFGP